MIEILNAYVLELEKVTQSSIVSCASGISVMPGSTPILRQGRALREIDFGGLLCFDMARINRDKPGSMAICLACGSTITKGHILAPQGSHMIRLVVWGLMIRTQQIF